MDDKNYNNEINVNNEQISSISEVKIEQQKEELNLSNNVSNDTVVSINNEPGSKKSTILLILLFIFLFAFVFGMPYINEFINELQSNSEMSQIKEDTIQDENQQNVLSNQESFSEVVETKEVVCTSQLTNVSNYTLLTTEEFYYDNNNQVLSSKIVYNYNFVIEDEEYNSLKKKCEEDSLKYLLNDGYTTACSYENLNIQISHEFDLETFATISDGDTIIEANVSYKQNIDEIKNNLISKGYTCE